MDLTREDAIRLHRWMWNDMRKALGDCPDEEAREQYKEKWCSQHGFNDVKHNCFLCEYSYRSRTSVSIVQSNGLRSTERALLHTWKMALN